ncbi:hypothetical protein C9J85_04640 [Haloferax sp. wsp5]|nr:hypothetical protein C9J85_04640 [Haloferax sp. wsp5]
MAPVDEAGYTGLAHQTGSPWSSFRMFATVLLGDRTPRPQRHLPARRRRRQQRRAGVGSRDHAVLSRLHPERRRVDFLDRGQPLCVSTSDDDFPRTPGNWAAGTTPRTTSRTARSGTKTFPGTEGMYTLHMDSFLYPADNPTPEATKPVAPFVGNVDAQRSLLAAVEGVDRRGPTWTPTRRALEDR